MMSMKEDIRYRLEKAPWFRERSKKNHGIGLIVLRKYGIEITPKVKDVAADIVSDITSADRAWRKLLEENPELRGTDYEEKAAVEEEWIKNNL